MLIEDQPDYGEPNLDVRLMADEADREAESSLRATGYVVLVVGLAAFAALTVIAVVFA